MCNINQLIAYYQHVSYLPRIQQHPVNNTYNSKQKVDFLISTSNFFFLQPNVVLYFFFHGTFHLSLQTSHTIPIPAQVPVEKSQNPHERVLVKTTAEDILNLYNIPLNVFIFELFLQVCIQLYGHFTDYLIISYTVSALHSLLVTIRGF